VRKQSCATAFRSWVPSWLPWARALS